MLKSLKMDAGEGGCISVWGNILGRQLEAGKLQYVWRPESSSVGGGGLESEVKGDVCLGRSREPWR